MSAKYGGIISVNQQSNVTVEYCKFQYIYSGLASVLYAQDLGVMSLKHSFFYDNYALSAGVLRVTNKAQIVLDNCTFAYNSAYNDHSIAMLIEIDPKSTINNCRFEKNFFVNNSIGEDLILILEIITTLNY